MKQLHITILLTMLISMVGVKVLAYDAKIDGIYYNFSGTEATVTYEGLDEDRDPYSDCKGNVIIPEKVIFNECPYSVTSIGENAFRGCELTSVTIPNSLRSIGRRAFYYCSGLTSVTVPNSVTSIGTSAFEGCSSLISIIIGNGVSNINAYTFGDCTKLKCITFGTGLLSISKAAFKDHLDSPIPQTGRPVKVIWQSETPPEGYKSCNFIGNPINYVPNNQYDFSGYTYEQIVYPFLNSMFEANGVMYVPTSMSECTCDAISCVYNESLETISIGKTVSYNGIAMTVKSISAYFCYYDFSSLTSVTIPNSITTIGQSAFQSCSGLTSITIPNSVTTIGQSAFSGCRGLTTITIPNSVTSVADYAFSNCSGLTLISIPNSVTSIGESAFRGNSGLTSITIPNSVTSIADMAFYGCSGLTSVTIPNSVTTIGIAVFYECSCLTSVTVDAETPLSIGSSTFSNRTNAKLYVPYGCKVAYEAANYWKEFKEIIEMAPPSPTIEFADANVKALCVANWDTDGDGELSEEEAAAVTDLGQVFKGNTKIKSFEELENFTSLTSIGSSAFYGCEALTSLTIPNSVTSIGNEAFYGCGLTSFTIPNNVTAIGADAFRSCTKLASITIGNGVTTIGERAFSWCKDGIASIVVSSGNKTFDSRDGCNAIISTQTNTLLVGCKNTVIPNSVTSIGNQAFLGCYGFNSITIPNSVTSIGDYAFSGCNDLTSMSIPNSVTSIGEHAFYGYNQLTSVTIPNSVTSIGNEAFGLCDLTSVTVNHENPLIIGSSTFYNRENTTLYVPYGCKTTYEAANYWKDFKEIIEMAPPSPTIVFADANVKAICVANWDTDGNGELSEAEAAAVTDLGQVFKGNTLISSFDELKYFAGLISIGNQAFFGCNSLISITIPNGVTSIGENAFAQCSNLNSVHISDLTSWCQIEFANEGANPLMIAHYLYVNGHRLTDLMLPSNLESLKPYSFTGGYFSSVSIPTDMITYNGSYAFSNSKIDRLFINNTIPDGCFKRSDIGYVEICTASTVAWRYAFYLATIGEVNIPYSDADFKYDSGRDYNGLFGECTIRKVSIDRNIKDSHYYNSARGAFFRCTIDTMYIGPNAINYTNNRLYDGCEVEDLYFIGISEIKGYTLYNGGGFYNNNIKQLHLPMGLVTIQANAFDNSNYTNYRFENLLVLPESLADIGSKAFLALDPDVSVSSLAKTPPTIADDSFRDYTYENPLYVPAGTKKLYEVAEGWKLFTNIIERSEGVGDDITFADENVKNRCIKLWDFNGDGTITLDEAAIVTSLKGFHKTLGVDPITAITSFDELRFFTGLTTIGYHTFYGCSQLSAIIIPSSVTSIGQEAFYRSGWYNNQTDGILYLDNWIIGYKGDGIEEINIMEGTKGIADGAFAYCRDLTLVAIPNSIMFIGTSAFSGCSGLTSVTIPQSVTSIGNRAFEGCSSLTSVTVEVGAPLKIDSYTFSNRSNATLYVPYGCKVAYEAAEYWNEFKEIVEIPSIIVNDMTICKGGKVNLPVSMENEEEITAFQFDVVVPEGVSIIDVQLGNRKCDSHTVDFNKQADGSFRVMGASLLSEPFSGNEGELISLMLSSEKDIEKGDYNIGIKNIVLTSLSKGKLYPADVSGLLSVLNIDQGDADRDGIVDVADIVAIVNYILENPSSDFLFLAADMNGDGEVDVFDVMIAINLVLNRDNSARSLARRLDAKGTLEPMYMKTAEDGIRLDIADAGRFTAFQFDVEVPDGAELTNAVLIGSEDTHLIRTAKTGENSYRVMAVSLDNSSLRVTPQGLLRLSLSDNSRIAVIDNIKFVTSQGESVYFSISQNDSTTGIIELGTEKNEEIYDMSGRRVSTTRDNLPKGIYIINNKKVVIK